MNTAIIFSSLKYINNNYSIVSSLARWIYEQLVINNYCQGKLTKILDTNDLGTIKLIIDFIKTPQASKIIDQHISFKNLTTDDILMLLINEGILELNRHLCTKIFYEEFTQAMNVCYTKDFWNHYTRQVIMQVACVNRKIELINTLLDQDISLATVDMLRWGGYNNNDEVRSLIIKRGNIKRKDIKKNKLVYKAYGKKLVKLAPK